MGRARAGTGRLLVCGAIGAVALACSSAVETDDAVETVDEGPDAAELVSEAAERTLSLDSFSIDVETVADNSSGEFTMSYHAPDRGRAVSSDGSIAIFAGREIYSSTPDDPDAFLLMTADDSAPLPIDQTLEPLRAVRDATDVRQEGNVYLMDLEDADASMEVQIEDGFVTYIRMEWQYEGDEFTMTQQLSEFDAVPPIELPAAGQVDEFPMTEVPDCPPGDTTGEPVVCWPHDGRDG